MHHMERKDLYNRIMSKDINQYKSIDKEVVKGVDGHRRAMNKWRKVDEDNESN